MIFETYYPNSDLGVKFQPRPVVCVSCNLLIKANKTTKTSRATKGIISQAQVSVTNW